MSHTPGPWVKDGWSILDQENRTVICNVLPWDSSGCRDEDISNARLIAAAPDMMEALERIIAVVRNGGTIYKGQEEYLAAIDAIRKAREK